MQHFLTCLRRASKSKIESFAVIQSALTKDVLDCATLVKQSCMGCHMTWDEKKKSDGIRDQVMLTPAIHDVLWCISLQDI